MLKVVRILCIAHALAGSAAMLGGCGQKGPLVLPDSPAAQGRATLPQSLNPWHKPATPADARPAASTSPPPAAAPAAPRASEPTR